MFRKIHFIACCAVLLVLADSGWSYGELLVRPSLSVSEVYDSNPYSRPRDTRVDDFATLVSPRLEFTGRAQRYTFRTAYSLNLSFYHDETSLNHVAHAMRLDADTKITKKTDLRLSDSFTVTQESLDAVTTGIQTPRGDLISNTLRIEAEHAFTPKTSGVLSYEDHLLEYENPELVDSRTDTVSTRMNRALTERTSVNVGYNYTYFTFDRDQNDTSAHGLRLGVSGRLTPTLTYDISGGGVYVEALDDLEWTTLVDLKTEHTNFAAHAGYTHEVTNTSGLNDEINISDRGYAELDFKLTRRLDLNLTSTIALNRSEPSTNIDAKSYAGGVNVKWQAFEWLVVNTAYSYFRQWTDGSIGNDILRNKVMVQLTAFPGVGRI